jgi:hypothetical protein
MTSRALLVILFCTIASVVMPAQEPQPAAKIDPAKEADIRRLLELTATGKIGVQVNQQMSQALRPMLERALPPGQDRSKKIIDTFLQKFQAQITPQAFIDLTVPIYDKHFSAEEIRGLIQFYESPLGKKMVSESPAIVDETGAAGRAWASQVVLKIFAEMETDFPEVKQLEEIPVRKP